ncbi:hypothetical protein [Ferrimonas pelagia]|uniref:Uncharacterized protein n=1 Tax=Ferrimonas pelagia TaxID=1177826 RepID=A0ABP9FIB9_9GAMM
MDQVTEQRSASDAPRQAEVAQKPEGIEHLTLPGQLAASRREVQSYRGEPSMVSSVSCETTGLVAILEQECQAMARFVLSKGSCLPPSVGQQLATLADHQTLSPCQQGAYLRQRAAELTEIHNRLSELVAPAKPETIVLMDK